MPEKFTVAWSDVVRTRACRQYGEGSPARRRWAKRRSRHLPARTLQTQYFCQREDAALFDLAEPFLDQQVKDGRRGASE